MSSFRSVLRDAFHRSGAHRLRLALRRRTLLLRSGAFHNEIGVRMHADPADPRGVELATYRGNLDRNAVAAWRRLVREFGPTVALDVGANYGEVAFSTRYQGLRELHLVEPNPFVLPWLTRTVRHAGGDFPRLVLHAGAAGDRDGFAQLYFHQHSGVASLRVRSDRNAEVECFRLDKRITLDSDDALLFKVDVEGNEQAVLEGMSGLLAGRRVAGICEILHADDALLAYLSSHFSVALLRAGREHPVNGAELRAAVATARASGWGDLSKDVVLRLPR